MDPKSIGHTTWVYQTSKSDENKKTKLSNMFYFIVFKIHLFNKKFFYFRKVVKAFFGLIVFLLLILAANISFENISDYYGKFITKNI